MAAIQDYATLTQAIQDFSHRDNLRPYIDYFILGAQEAIQNDVFDANFGNGLRVQEVAFGPTAIADDGTLAVPSDWLVPKLMTVAASGQQSLLSFKSPAWIYDAYPLRTGAGIPSYIARDGDSFIFGPAPDSDYLVQGTYYQSATVLSNAAPTNWMTQACPYLLLGACMIEAGKFLVDDALTARWSGIYSQRMKALIDADKSERWAPSTMQIDLG